MHHLSINPGWTNERVARLRELFHAGVSFSGIAKDLGGVTRNAVIGKASRIGLPGRSERQPSAPRVPRVPRPLAAERVVVRASRPAPVEVPTPVRSAPVPCGPGLPLEKLSLTTCRWPIGPETGADQLFCGAVKPAEGGAYCEAHGRLALAAPNGRKPSTMKSLAGLIDRIDGRRRGAWAL